MDPTSPRRSAFTRRNTPSRRQVLATVLAGATAGLAGCGNRLGLGDPGENVPSPTGTPTTDAATPAELPDAVGLETVATGFEAPLDLAVAPDADRRYVADQVGAIYAVGPDGRADEPALDLRDAVDFGGEKGLLGVALHPEFASNRRAFVRYSAPPRSGTPDGYSHTFVLAEFAATDDGSRLRRDSERTILEIPEPQGNHNAGDLAFGPDGYLYVAVGDGGAGGDRGPGHVDDWYDGNGGGNGQDVTENLLGSILRIDVDGEGENRPYAVPDGNPLVGSGGRDEHYAWGLRNPWRMSFDVRDPDAGEDGWDLYVADVGQNRYEEVNLVERGGNYGWNVREATHCFGGSDCPDATPASVRGGEPLLDPVIEYAHTGDGVSGISVIGGYVYRGSAVPGLSETYVFGDYRANGRLFVATRPGGGGTSTGTQDDTDDGLWPTQVVPVADADAGKLGRLLGFGRDADGEVYVLGTGDDGGGVYRIAPGG